MSFSTICSVTESENLEIFIISKAVNVIVTLFCGLRTEKQGSWISVFGSVIHSQGHSAQVVFLLLIEFFLTVNNEDVNWVKSEMPSHCSKVQGCCVFALGDFAPGKNLLKALQSKD